VIERFIDENKEEMQVENVTVLNSMDNFNREFKIGEIDVRIRKVD